MRSWVEDPVPVVMFVNYSFLVFDVPQIKQSVFILNVDVSVRQSLVGPLSAMSLEVLPVALDPCLFCTYSKLLVDVYQALNFV